MRQSRARRHAKARQSSKIAEIRAVLLSAGCDTVAEQAAVLGLGRSTTWALFNQNKSAGPSASVIKRILSSSKLPISVRQKFEEYVEGKIAGLYGHSDNSKRAFSNAFPAKEGPPPKARAISARADHEPPYPT